MKELKYYLYIADAKVDMLLSQIKPGIKKKVASEIGIDLKVLVAKRKTESSEGEDRIARLEAVVEFIRTYGNVGTVDKPDEYIDDALSMRFISAKPESKGYADLIYLSGRSKNSVFGLGGTAANLIGARPAGAEFWMSNSNTYAMLHKLHVILRDDRVPPNEEEGALWPVVDLEFDRRKTPYEKFEFLAKRLVTHRQTVMDRKRKMNVILATPLYIAKAD